jgi:hypothetical protein
MEHLEARPGGERWCYCVKDHVPKQLPMEAEAHHIWPLGEGGPDISVNMIYVCPTTHTKIHNLWRLYDKYDPGKVPYNIIDNYSLYVRRIVLDGWTQMKMRP